MPPTSVTSLIKGDPTSGLMAKFSMPYVVASALIDHDIKLDTFSDARFRRSDIAALMRLVTLVENAELPIFEFPVEQGYVDVIIRTKTGAVRTARTAYARGFPERPLSKHEIVDKFRDCARQLLSESQIEGALAAISKLEDVIDITAIIPLLSQQQDRPPQLAMGGGRFDADYRVLTAF